MGELISGLVLLTVGICTALLTRRADRQRTQLMKTISPNNGHPGIILYAKVGRALCSAIFLIGGTIFIILGIDNLAS